MNQEKIGQFIADLRKSKHMTQKDLAATLGVSDPIISNWERGVSCPAPSLLYPLADALGVTIHTLLTGEIHDAESEPPQAPLAHTAHLLPHAFHTKTLQRIGAFSFSVLSLIGLVVCAICDLALSGQFTWSRFPISSIVFAWLVFFPVIRFGEKGVRSTLLALSVLIVPFLYVLDQILQVAPLLLPIGVPIALSSILFLWVIVALFRRLSTRKLIASALSLLLCIPFCLFLNFTLARLISEPLVSFWDVLGFFLVGSMAIVLFTLDSVARKKTNPPDGIPFTQ